MKFSKEICMSALTDYTQDEIEKLMAAPLLTSMYVMGASLSGPIGLVKEMMAGVDTAMKAGKAAAPGTLLNSLFSEENMKKEQDKMQQETKESTQGAQNMDEAKTKILRDLKSAVYYVSTKGSAEEADAFKKLMIDVAEKVANAAKEGGFMGIGGTLVNDAEKGAIAEITAAMNGPLEAPPPAEVVPAESAPVAEAPATEAPAAEAPPASDPPAPAAA
jgi:hypothetical protein